MFCTLCLLGASPLSASEATATPSVRMAFDAPALANVLTNGIAFILPRTLEAYPIRTFSLWGLDGLTAIDPAITISEHLGTNGTHQRLDLQIGQKKLFSQAEPSNDDLKGWVSLVLAVFNVAWNASPALQSSGSDALLQSFFDELFNHLDPYSRYVAPSPAAVDRTARSGGEGNIGISLVQHGPDIIIRSINANGPAWSANLTVGSRILRIDGQSVAGKSAALVLQKLDGAVGSDVRLEIKPRHGRKIRSISLRREQVPPQTVFSETRDHIAIIRITAFSADTAEELSQYLDQTLLEPHLKGLIIDLRGDRGGVLQQAVTAIALVLNHGVAAITKGRDPLANRIWTVKGGDMTQGLPIVVLVDGRTASAAEIMAAALADHRRAVVVGSATLGKGLVQAVGQMPNGGELFVTWSRVIAPLGWPLQGLGVIPQICTSLGELKAEQQIALLRTGILDEVASIQRSRNARYPVPVATILAIRRHCPAALGTEIDYSIARTLIDEQPLYHAALSAMPAISPTKSP